MPLSTASSPGFLQHGALFWNHPSGFSQSIHYYYRSPSDIMTLSSPCSCSSCASLNKDCNASPEQSPSLTAALRDSLNRSFSSYRDDLSSFVIKCSPNKDCNAFPEDTDFPISALRASLHRCFLRQRHSSILFFDQGFVEQNPPLYPHLRL